MANEKRTRVSAVLIKVETTAGVDATPGAADAVLFESFASPVGVRQIESNENTGSLDTGDPIPVGAPSSWTFSARLRGVTGAPTLSNLPPLDPVLRAACFERVLLASISAAALVSGTTTSGVAGVTFPNTNRALFGAALDLSGPNHAGRRGAVTAWTVNRQFDTADVFSPALSDQNSIALPAQAIYRPLDGADISAIPTLTVYHYMDGVLRKMVGARATLSISMDTAGVPIVSGTLMGTFAGEIDAALPTGMAPSRITPPLFSQGSASSPAFLMDYLPVGISSFSVDAGVTLVSPPDPNTPQGFAGGVPTLRNMTLSFDPQMLSVATRDFIAMRDNGTLFPVVARARGGVGNRLQIVVPQARVLTADDGDREGIATRQVQGKASGINAGFAFSFS